MKPLPVFGCAALLILAAVAGALAVGGSFWSWIVVTALVLIVGIAVVIYLARRNSRSVA